MLDPANDLPPSSPSVSSRSSSDVDTQSTGSFFHDRSTTLGTLMGVNFSTITFRATSQHRRDNITTVTAVAGNSSANRRNKIQKQKVIAQLVAERRRWRRKTTWWRLCRNVSDEAGNRSRSGSLAEYLEVERRFDDVAFDGDAAGALVDQQSTSHRRLLFADGRVLPPRDCDDDDGVSSTVGIFSRFPVSLTGICSGGSR